MRVEVRVYKLFDIDIASLMNAGFPVAAMMKEAIISFAHGTPVKYLIDRDVSFDLSCKKSIHTAFDIPPDDEVTIRLLKSVIRGYRNTFCKMIFRNSLVIQNLQGFIGNQSLFSSSVKNTLLKSEELFRGDAKKLSEFKECNAAEPASVSQKQKRERKKAEKKETQPAAVSPSPISDTTPVDSEKPIPVTNQNGGNNTDMNALLLQYIQSCMANGQNPFEQMKQSGASVPLSQPVSTPVTSPAPPLPRTEDSFENHIPENDDDEGIQVAKDTSILDMFDAL